MVLWGVGLAGQVPHTDGALAHLLALLVGDPVEVDPSLRPPSVLDDRKPPHEPKIPQGAAPDPKLLDRVHQAIRARHYRRSTEQAYVAWIRRFIFFHSRESWEATLNSVWKRAT